MYVDDLFANHLAFIAMHRGSVRLEGRNVHIDGPGPGLISFVPGSQFALIPRECPAVRLAPWSGGEGWSGTLEGAGFHRAEALSYMELANSNAALAPSVSIEIKVVRNRVAADTFAAIQAAGFATDDKTIDAWWAPYFEQQARQNFEHPAQCFYLGYLDGEPVASTLIVRSSGVTGIYAVATAPAFRKRGVSAAMLERARCDALVSGFPRVILQALVGSYAETYYANLGFLKRYTSQVWRR